MRISRRVGGGAADFFVGSGFVDQGGSGGTVYTTSVAETMDLKNGQMKSSLGEVALWEGEVGAGWFWCCGEVMRWGGQGAKEGGGGWGVGGENGSQSGGFPALSQKKGKS